MNTIIRSILTLLFVAFTCFTSLGQALTVKKQVWDNNQLTQPADLAAVLAKPKAKKPVVYNIGFVGDIEGAKKIGAASKKEGLENLQAEVKGLSKSTAIVIYCGCCPFEHCPNVRPAYTLLQDMGFKEARILNLPTSIKADWIDKGYPMSKK
jgi:hypothetical protein